MKGKGREEKEGEGREEGRGGKGGKGRAEEAFLVMWPRRLSALNPPLFESVCWWRWQRQLQIVVVV